MLQLKDLPPMEREGNGSLYRMDAKQRREAVRLIRAHCSFYDNGNCLYLMMAKKWSVLRSLRFLSSVRSFARWC